MAHTPTPWSADRNIVSAPPFNVNDMASNVGKTFKKVCITDNDCYSSTEECAANAEFIVLACNAHDALVDALEHLTRTACRPGDDSKFDDSFDEARNKARTILASVKGAK